MNRTSAPFAAALLCLLLAACRGAADHGTGAAAGPPAEGTAPWSADTAARTDVAAPWVPGRTFHGDGFTLGYPAAAHLQQRDPDGDERSAVEVAGLPGCADDCFLTIRTYDDPSRGGAAEWVRGLLREDSAGAGQEDEHAYDDPPQWVDLGGEKALRLDHACEDCGWMEYYVARGTRVVGIELIVNDGVGRENQDRLMEKLEAMLRSFRWDPASREEAVPPAPPAGIQS